jgi:exodeoxyribonuclease V alpha subunit
LDGRGGGWTDGLRDVLGDGAWAAALELGRFIDEGLERDAVIALAAACLDAARQGSTRVPLLHTGPGGLPAQLERLGVPEAVRQATATLTQKRVGQRGAAEVVLGQRGDVKPLILDGEAVCLHRLDHAETGLGERLRARLAAPPVEARTGLLEAALRDVLALAPRLDGGEVRLSDEQQRAVLAAAQGALTVISGGPGTGKTSIVVSMLRVLLRLGLAPEAIALAAPTGKAAHRMESAIRRYLGGVGAPAAEDRLLDERLPAPSTLHRLLGYSSARDRFTHHAGNPLAHDVVIVDEASMIDLDLMDRLVRAVRPEARLVLLGDAEQLPSVDAGAVLRDLVPVAGVGRSEDLRARAAVRLTHSFRMDESDPEGRAVYQASLAVRQGETPPLARTPGDGPQLLLRVEAAQVQFSRVELLEADAAERRAFFARWFQARVVGDGAFSREAPRVLQLAAGDFEASSAAALEQLDRRLQQARILCLTRRQVEEVNWQLTRALRDALDLDDDAREPFSPGVPVLMTKNDYQLGLFNGDQGLAVRVQRADEPAPRLRYVFRVRGRFECFEPGALASQVEPCWAMTVHKSQGSEFDHVALVLPLDGEVEPGDDAAALACREVVYTAMTRARRSVAIVASTEALEAAVGRSLVRFSALSDPARWRP